MKTTQADYAKTALRLPRELHDEVHRAARESERSFNAEIIHRLKGTFRAPQQATQPASQQ
jgi:hypothetical protein